MNKQSIQTNSEVKFVGELVGEPTLDQLTAWIKAKVARENRELSVLEAWCVVSDQARDLKAEVKRLQLYEDLYKKAAGACLWMHDDKTLDLKLGAHLTIDGVTALRKQRDKLRTANMWWVDHEMSTECIEDDLDNESFDPGDHIVEVTCARSLPNEFYIWHVPDWNDDSKEEDETKLTGPFKTRAEAESAK